MPYNSKPEANAPRTKYFIAASVALAESRRKAISAYSASDNSSNPMSYENKGLENIIIVNALDLLYFWMYQPRARTVLARLLQEMSVEERKVFLLSQYVLLREREISQLFLDGLVGKNFARALAFYLDTSRQYLEDLQAVAARLEVGRETGAPPTPPPGSPTAATA